MTNFKTRIRVAVLMLAAGICLMLAVGCQSPGGGTNAGVVASFVVGDPAKDGAFAKYDGNTFCASGHVDYVGELYIAATGAPLYIRAGQREVTLVHRREPEFSWQGKPHEPIAGEAEHLFRLFEVNGWNLTFLPITPPQP